MKKFLWTLLLVGLSKRMGGLGSNCNDQMEIARLKMSLTYVKSIETFRLLFISILGIGLCLIFVVMSLILFHTTLFLYTPWDMETKMLAGFLCSAVYLLIAVVAFSYIFDQNKWLKIFHAEKMLGDLTNPTANTHPEKEAVHG